MPKVTTAYVKNVIRRSFREIIDPAPDKESVSKVWAFFNSMCAYCGTALDRLKKEGHIDHLISASQKGPNHLGNRVLSCATCNEKEKLDLPWESFLEKKLKDSALFKERKRKILEWLGKNQSTPLDEITLKAIDALADETVEFYESRVKSAKAIKKEGHHQ
jgi:hypothetical protein